MPVWLAATAVALVALSCAEAGDTGILLTVLSPGLEVDEVAVYVEIDGAMYDLTAPEMPGELLSDRESLELLVDSSLGGATAVVRVDGRRGGAFVAAGRGEVVLVANEIVSLDVVLSEECTPGLVECRLGSVLVICDERGRIESSMTCDFGCNADVVPPRCNLCPPDTTDCIGSDLVTCGPDGMPTDMTACPLGCSQTRLECNECDPTVPAQCSGEDLVTCDADGLVGATASCEYGCQESTIPHMCNECFPSPPAGPRQCQGDMSIECNPLGIVVYREACSSGCDTVTGTCVACVPDTDFCSAAGGIGHCDSSGTVASVDPCTYGCSEPTAGMPVCNACTPDPTDGADPECQGSRLVSCDSAGNQLSTMVCAYGCQTGTSPHRCNACTPSTTECRDDDLVMCSGTGTVLSSTPCAYGCDSATNACVVATDADGDMVPDSSDNCPTVANPLQTDTDGDGSGDVCDDDDDGDGILDDGDGSGTVGDATCTGGGTTGCDDNCRLVPNPLQNDINANGVGDSCEGDSDGDGITDPFDNCPGDFNPLQADGDGDGTGDVCDTCPVDPLDDGDGDGRCADADNCPTVANPSQTDTDGDGRGDACDVCRMDAMNDGDGDGVCGDVDNCPALANPSQTDTDSDGAGDACDPCPSDPLDDPDGDGVCNGMDNCPGASNASQTDSDSDGAGDACDPCPMDSLDDVDGDGRCADVDNCPVIANTSQADADSDGVGDACDPCPTDPTDSCCRIEDLQLSEVHANSPDYIELINTGACTLDVSGVQLVFQLDCDTTMQTYTFPMGTSVPAGDNLRLVEASSCTFSNEICFGANICDNPSGEGWVALCDGACDLTTCGNLLDYFEKANDLMMLPVPPACADFSPGPLSTMGEAGGQSSTRIAFTGGGAMGVRSDWSIGPMTRSVDTDGDGVDDATDNCPAVSNAGQSDGDSDGVGDACDNCVSASNAAQTDTDSDGAGDACDPDDDNDGVADGSDNCPRTANTSQADGDSDGLGDACDPCPADPTNGCCVPFPGTSTDSFGYFGCSLMMTPSTLPCPDISATGTDAALTDDSHAWVPIGFSFDFYGTAHTNVAVQSNGTLTFTDAYHTLSNVCLPTSTDFIAVMWDDLNPGNMGSSVKYQTLGTAPNRSFVVQWNTERFSTSPMRVDMRAVLHEGSNDIDVCYHDGSFGSATYDYGLNATAGINGPSSSLQYSCNTADLDSGLLLQYQHP